MDIPFANLWYHCALCAAVVLDKVSWKVGDHQLHGAADPINTVFDFHDAKCFIETLFGNLYHLFDVLGIYHHHCVYRDHGAI